MEKETYIAPAIEVMNIEPVEMCATSSIPINGYDNKIHEGTKFRDGGDDFWW